MGVVGGCCSAAASAAAPSSSRPVDLRIRCWRDLASGRDDARDLTPCGQNKRRSSSNIVGNQLCLCRMQSGVTMHHRYGNAQGRAAV